MQINKIRKKILEEIKPYIAENGWHKDIIVDFVKSSNFKHHEIISLFPDGYYSLIQMFLDEINIKMGKDFK